MKKSLLSFVLVALTTSALTQNINMSNGTTNTCSANFYDSGGPGGNYGNNQNLSHTFFPATPGSAIEISFTSYVSGPADQIAIYDGPDNSYPLLFMDGGNLTIPNFVSSDFSGALTIEFTSNASGTQAGWVASISCCSSPQWWYADNDGDGFGSMWDYVFSCTPPPGYLSNGDDCDDSAVMYEDNDGDGFGTTTEAGCGSYDNTDCDDNAWTYEDNDGDNFGNPNVFAPCGVADNTDCDDNDNAIGSGIFFEYYADNDGDGFGNGWDIIFACTLPPGYVTNSDDCDDWSITYEDLDGDGYGNPSVMVPCGAYDNTDCDDNLLLYADTDGDGFGDPNVTVPCAGVTDNTDCDDTDNSVGSGILTAYYDDLDGDGWGNPWGVIWSCSPIPGTVTNDDDCDDWSITYEDLDGDGYGNPLIEAPCGVYDNSDCDDTAILYNDNDGDGFGDPNFMVPCSGVTDSTDCDDYDNSVGGGAMTAYYEDWDFDGYGNPWFVYYSCFPVPGMVSNNTDCDDWNDQVNPGMTEIPGNGIDDDCDGVTDPAVGISEKEKISFSIYPNPADNVVYLVNGSNGWIEAQLFNISGQAVSEGHPVEINEKLEINVGHLESGIYFLRIQEGLQIQMLKLIVK